VLKREVLAPTPTPAQTRHPTNPQPHANPTPSTTPEQVLLLRESAEGARIEAMALRRQLDEAASGAAQREQDEH
jgi:hypothetical protein